MGSSCAISLRGASVVRYTVRSIMSRSDESLQFGGPPVRPAAAVANPWFCDKALWLIVAIFGALRAAALANDLWLDELWTLWHVNQLRSVGEILSRFIHDNNHPLNTLWMYAIAPLKTDWAYRLLSWLGGTAGVWLAAKVAAVQLVAVQRDATTAQVRTVEWITALLFGSSYLLIVYSSEARGYGPALGLGLL